MTNLAFPLTMLALVITLTIALAFIPQISQPAAPLGVRVPSGKLNDRVVRLAISRYRLLVIASGLLSAVLAAVFSTSVPIIAALSTLVVTIVSIGAYVTQRKKIIAVKESERWFDGANFAVSGDVSRESQSLENILPPGKAAALEPLIEVRFPWIYMLLSMVSLSVAVLVVVANWDSIPQTIATHWGPSLQPDAWSEKSIGSVFIGSFVALGLLVLMAVVGAILVNFQVHNRTDRSIHGQLRTRVMIAATSIGLGIVTLTMTVGMSILQVVSVLPQYQHLLGWAFAFMLVSINAAVIAMLILLANRQGKLQNILRGVKFGDEQKESPDNDNFYKWGMFYYNPNDPAVIVEKRFGTGFDFNYASWQAKAFMAVIFLSLIATFALVFI